MVWFADRFVDKQDRQYTHNVTPKGVLATVVTVEKQGVLRILSVFVDLVIQHAMRVRQWRAQEFCSRGGGSTNSVEDRGQRGRGSGGGSPLLSDS